MQVQLDRLADDLASTQAIPKRYRLGRCSTDVQANSIHTRSQQTDTLDDLPRLRCRSGIGPLYSDPSLWRLDD